MGVSRGERGAEGEQTAGDDRCGLFRGLRQTDAEQNPMPSTERGKRRAPEGCAHQYEHDEDAPEQHRRTPCVPKSVARILA
jgi:hypothetical protein